MSRRIKWPTLGHRVRIGLGRGLSLQFQLGGMGHSLGRRSRMLLGLLCRLLLLECGRD